MTNRKSVFSLILCYILWGFQPLYWSFIPNVHPYVLLACRIIMATVFSCLILLCKHRFTELLCVFRSREILKYLLPAVVFLAADWAVFLIVVNAGHVLDASLGYYINPLVLFAFGVVIYKEKCTRIQLAALAVAVISVLISTAAFGSFPYISLIIAVNWAIYTVFKKKIQIDGVLSIAAETLILTPFAIAFLLLFRRADLAAMDVREILFMVGSGIITALPMFLFSNSVAAFPLIVMCFAQYLSPTFNLLCGLLMGESFSRGQIVSFLFFIAAICLFTFGEIRQQRSRLKE